MKKPAHWILLAAFLALLSKLYCAATTLGTSDGGLFRSFGMLISEAGLPALYRGTRLFNHTPLVGTFSSLLFDLTHPNAKLFVFLLRVPGILADFGTILLLLRLRQKTGRPPWWALALLAVSPISFMVSGYHGNVDSIMVFFLVAAALCCVEGDARLCGLAFALACNIKVVPLLVAPAFFFFWLQRGNGRAFFTTATVTILAGWSYALLTVPREFCSHVLGYSGYWGSWGVTFWLAQTPLAALQTQRFGFAASSALQMQTIFLLKLVIVGSALALAWRRRAFVSAEIFRTLGLIWVVFFAFAPGLGGQYFVWLSPFLLLLCPVSFAVFTGAASVSLFIFYTVISKGLPWYSGLSTTDATRVWQPWMNLTWFAVVGILIWHRRALLAHDSVPSSTDHDSAQPAPASLLEPTSLPA